MENTNKESKSSLRQEKLAKFDTRGVQTLFKTLSRNHYMLLKMIDNKARIILTVNSIITSLLFGIHFITTESKTININIGTKILVISSMLSMIFALISMLPHRYLGKVFQNSGYKGTLYAANFSKQSLSEFKKEIERIMDSGNSVYDEMIYDIYFLGLVITKKQQLLYVSVIVLLIGVLATLTYAIFSI
ncbi:MULTISPECIES: Pycsar system effector family protein [unclassified Flavobacterium]|uniref:Pycsar system effector family protein n=1 Tax=Flavobacterium sp. N2270 TaxID=2986831 RepID=UPI00222444AC|nr:Pycsar system effector family protein [Flavobacterium sp. N2270]